MGDAVATPFAGVVAGIEVEIAFVARQVINAVRNQLAFTGTGKIMIQHLHGRLCMGMAFSGEMADQFLLLGIDADHRVACGPIRGLELGHVLKRRIPVRMRPQRFFLAHLALPQSVLFHQLTNRVPTGWRAQLGQTAADLTARQIGPQDAFPHRIARREFGENLAEIFLQ